jgi:hypothetical protein
MADDWSLEDEHAYKTLDRDITAAMLITQTLLTWQVANQTPDSCQ